MSMLIDALLSKIHRARVTEANLDYVGSVTIDKSLAEAAKLREFQKVTITNLRNGTLWYTYVMYGDPGSGVICLNGPPAHHFQPGDLVIILAYGLFSEEDFQAHHPVVVFVDEQNRVTSVQQHSCVGAR
jgi:aspartate 1-decarboxylase